MKDKLLKSLNPEQQEAVEHGQGPLLIIAGAGTGKTTVITERVKYLMARGEVKPEEILALTFTEKAAREMQERIDIAMPYSYGEMWVSTFHAFCDRILKAEAIHIGMDPNFRLLSGAEEVQFLIDNLFKFDLQYFRPLGNPTKFVDGMLQHFSRLRDEDISPADYLKFAQSKNEEQILELAKAFKTYEKLKIAAGRMDFSDLVAKTLELFRKRKNVLKIYQEKFKQILVDEFQDTNFAQYELLKLLAPPESKPNITVVGDDSQSIYKFRGAAISNILQFMEDYKQAKQVVLVKNYRSSQIILDSAYKLIKNNDPDTLEAKLGISKDLQAIRKVPKSKVEFIYTNRVENEAEAVAKKIIQLKQDESYENRDFAILMRANNQAEVFTQALSRAGIPYQFLGPGQLLRQPEVKDLIAYLKLLDDFGDNVALYRVLSMPIFGITGRQLATIGNLARRENLTLFEACERAEELFLNEETKAQIKKFTEMVSRHLNLREKETAGQILYYFLEDSGLLKQLAEAKTDLEDKQIQNISKFFNRLKSYEVDHEDASVRAVIKWLNLSMYLGDSPLASNTDWTEENRVNLLTVHSAKGLEFPVVFVVNLTTGRFPTYERHEQIPIAEELIKEILPVGDYHLEEERRLFYVALTRARDFLFLTSANWYGEGKRERKVSPFVFEALGKIDTSVPIETEAEQLSFLSWSKPMMGEKQTRKREKIPVTYLSFSQIETYNTCPLQYRYRYLQRIPVAPSAALVFGDTMHKTLKEIYLLIKNEEKIDLEKTLDILKSNWNSRGFMNKIQEEKLRDAGERMLKDFLEKNKPFKKPLVVEQAFITKLSNGLKLGGKIDRVEVVGEEVQVIDYKTGKTWEQKEVDKSLQMTAYALAVTDPGLYNFKPESVKLTFYFLDSGQSLSTKRSKADLEKAKMEIIAKAKEIEEGDFKPTPGMWCDFCDYKLICEAWR